MAFQSNLLSKTLVIGIIILFIGVAIAPMSLGIKIVYDRLEVKEAKSSVDDGGSKTVIIVDDEGEGDYTSIQDAIDNATEGDIIEVYSGIYYEEIIVITIEDIILRGIPYELGAGDDFGKPVIKDITDIGSFIIFNNSGITVDGFVLEGNESSFLYNIVNFVIGDNNVLSNCDIRGNGLGSCVCVYNKIKNTKIINNNLSAMGTGIILAGINNFVIGNRINNMGSKGIVCNNKYCNVSSNLISECDWGIEIGCNNKISNNIITNCDFGIIIDGQLENVSIEYNEFKHNLFGIVILDEQRQVRMFYRNNIIKNLIDVCYIHVGKLHLSFNTWYGNYWDKWKRIGPKRIFGIRPIPIFFIPTDFPFIIFIPFIRTVAYDLRPARKPYDIGTAQGCDIV